MGHAIVIEQMCLDLQTYLRVQRLRFQHVSAYWLRKTSGIIEQMLLVTSVFPITLDALAP